MVRTWMRLSLLPVMALSLILAACDGIGGTDGLLSPQAETSLLGSSGNGYTVVKEKDTSVGAVTGVIGSSGGKLVLGKHELWVPRDAVSGPTTFVMIKSSDELRFTLRATRLTLNDIGSRGFAQPVKLVVNYRDASIADPSILKVFWAKLDGTFEAQPTEIDVVGYRAIGNLKHFSDYILAVP